MDNSMATTPFSTLKGDAYRAYEELPVEVRLALQEALVDWCPLRTREWHRHLLTTQRVKPARAAAMLVDAIRGHDHAEVAAFARRWAKGAKAYPHLAAEATIQRYAGAEGMPAAKAVMIAPPAPRTPAQAPAARPAATRPAAKRVKVKTKAKPKARIKRAAGRRSRR